MKINVISIFVLMLVVSSIVFGQDKSISEQNQIENSKPFISAQGNEIPENIIFERLFKSVNSYNEEADKQLELGFPQRAYTLQTHYKRNVQLSDNQAQKLKEIANDFQLEVDVIKKQKGKVVRLLKEQFDNAKLQTKLDRLYESRGQLWAKYRDLLREAFGFEKFQQLKQFLQESFASKIKSNVLEVKKHPRFTSRKLSNPSSVMTFYDNSYSDVYYSADTDVVYGSSITWIDSSAGGGGYFPEFSSSSVCDPEESYCWNVSLEAGMSEPDGNNSTPASGEGCDGYVEVYLYPNSEVESGNYYIDGDHAGQQNIGSNPYCGLQGFDIISFSSDFVTVYKPKVDILLNGTPITNTTRNVIVGQQISLSATVTGGIPSNPQWTIPGNKIKNYAINYTNPTSATSAEATDLVNSDFTQPSIAFYWIDGAESRQVQYSVTINNRPYTARATFNVKAPTVTVNAVTSLTTIYRNKAYQELLFGQRSRFGEAPRLGIAFTKNSYQLPAGLSGDTVWVQVIRYSYKRTLPDGQTIQIASSSGLDSVFPYASGDPNANATADSPGVCLRICDDSTSFIKMEVQVNADMYLMFKPSNLPSGVNSIYVPLKEVNWYWTAVATRLPDQSFTLTSSSNSPDSVGQTTTNFPLWDRVVTAQEPYQ